MLSYYFIFYNSATPQQPSLLGQPVEDAFDGTDGTPDTPQYHYKVIAEFFFTVHNSE
jgi:hypothetical protein